MTQQKQANSNSNIDFDDENFGPVYDGSRVQRLADRLCEVGIIHLAETWDSHGRGLRRLDLLIERAFADDIDSPLGYLRKAIEDNYPIRGVTSPHRPNRPSCVRRGSPKSA